MTNVPGRKRTMEALIRPLRPASWIRVPVSGMQVIVENGESVCGGDLLAVSPPDSALGLRRHSPYTGRVVSITDGFVVLVGEPTDPRPIDRVGGGALEAARAGGLVGMGGGMFPTWRKLIPTGPPVDAVIVNACQSEPYVTCDYRVMVEHEDEVMDGLARIQDALGAARGLVAHEREGYPAGHEASLVQALLGRKVPSGGRPRDVGAVVFNVQTVRALHQAASGGRPLVDRVVTVDGGAVARPGNYRVCIGTELGHVLAMCGADLSRAAEVFEGGPMMGRPAELDQPVTPGTIAILALTADEVSPCDPMPCIRCGTCLEVCPVGLWPADLVRRPTPQVDLCTECGICEFACPSHRPLVTLLRAARLELRNPKGAGR